MQESYCNSCQHIKNDNFTMKNSWDGLHRGNWSFFTELYNNNPSGIYDTNSTSWTRGANVTPNEPKWILNSAPVHKENFEVNNHSSYARLNNTWNRQKQYTSN